MRCPLCVDQVLDAHVRGGIEIDICPRCRGIWLDRGELDKLVDQEAPTSIASTPAPPPRSEPARPTDQSREWERDRARGRDDRDRDDRDRKKKKKKRKKSKAELLVDLLEDVFD